MHVLVLKHSRSIRIIIYFILGSFNIIFKSRTMKRPIGQEQEERNVKVRFRYCKHVSRDVALLTSTDYSNTTEIS